MSLKEKIRAANDVERHVIEVPEWDVSIEVRSMTVRQRAAFVMANQDTSDSGAQRVERVYGQILVQCCLDPDTSEPIFEEADLDWLMSEKSGAVIDNLVSAVLEASRLKEKAVDEAGKSSLGSPTTKGEPIQSDEPTSS